MFCGCKSLTQAPELPVTTLAVQCYYYMFLNCKGLNKVICLATDISASGATEDWLSGVAANGTFTKAEGVEGWTMGASGIPVGWTVQDYKQAATVTKAPTAKNLTYNGQVQALVEAGTAEGGKMQYVLGTATTAPTSGWSASIFTAPNAGTYYVWYKVVGDENHTDTEAKCVTVIIAEPEKTVYTITLTNDGNGSASANPGSGYEGTEVTLSAAPKEGYNLKEWQVISGGVTVQENKFTISSANIEIKAIFEKIAAESASYSVVSGSGQDYVLNSGSDALFITKRSINDEETFTLFTGIQVDEKDVDASLFDAESGSVKIR